MNKRQQRLITNVGALIVTLFVLGHADESAAARTAAASCDFGVCASNCTGSECEIYGCPTQCGSGASCTGNKEWIYCGDE